MVVLIKIQENTASELILMLCIFHRYYNVFYVCYKDLFGGEIVTVFVTEEATDNTKTQTKNKHKYRPKQTNYKKKKNNSLAHEHIQT